MKTKTKEEIIFKTLAELQRLRWRIEKKIKEVAPEAVPLLYKVELLLREKVKESR
jgi:hypothetical protein